MKGIIKIIKNKYEGQIDTGKMMSALLIKVQDPGIGIFNNCLVKKLIPELDITSGRGQVLITEPIKDLKIKGNFHYNMGYTYFRKIDNRILLGGGRNLDFKGE